MTTTNIDRPPATIAYKCVVMPILAVVIVVAVSVIFYRHNTRFSRDSRFVATKLWYPPITLSPNATLKDRANLIWFRFQYDFNRPPPTAFTFTNSAKQRCSIYALLNQCTDVTCVRYLIAKDVAAGSVEFGNTNTMSGIQWTAAFTSALQADQPEWWDSQSQRS